MSRPWVAFVLLTAAIAGGLLATLFLMAGLENNNQGEYFDPLTGAIDWGSVTLLGLSGFLPPFLLIAIASLAIAWLVRPRQASPTSRSS